MVKLLLLYDQMNTTTEVNLSGILSLYNDGLHICRISPTKAITIEDLNWCDACIANRPSSIYAVNISKAIRRSGRLFMSFFDDDLLGLPRGNSGRWKKKYVLTCVKNSDAVITPSPVIAEKIKKIVSTPNFIVIDTHVREEEIRQVPECQDKVRIVYAAGNDHTELFDFFIKPSLSRLKQRYDNKIEFTLMGINPDLSHIPECNWIHQIDIMPYEMYRKYMMDHDFDLGLSPLLDNSFSNQKYFNKFFEYSKNGIAGLYSNCLPYTLVIDNQKNGVLVDNTVEAWFQALCHAIDNIDKMKEMVYEAQLQLKTKFSIHSIREIVHNSIDPLIDTNIKENVSYDHAKFLEIYYELLSRVHQITAHIYKDGFSKTMKKAYKAVVKH